MEEEEIQARGIKMTVGQWEAVKRLSAVLGMTQGEVVGSVVEAAD